MFDEQPSSRSGAGDGARTRDPLGEADGSLPLPVQTRTGKFRLKTGRFEHLTQGMLSI
jgi:hypothetical protein